MFVFKASLHFLQSIEEAFKVNFPSHGKPPDLKLLRDMIFEMASKCWFSYIESEKKSSFKASWELQSQLQQVRQKQILTIKFHSFINLISFGLLFRW